MKLKRLELNGFKSFSEKTVVSFPRGISGVVGPNGCGKSNIVDAIKWVMGEQSPKQLRGKGMEDVIFSGANGKPSVGMAEVSLVLDNDNGSIPKEYADYSEVVVTRRLYRDGESEYAINHKPCRLKDVVRLFMDTGVGSKAYSVIEQGRVGAIIDSKPEDRRYWIEEAAGISKYKSQKQETLRKLELAQQNLLRVSDVIAEVKRQMNSLYRQAKKAERFKEIRRQSKEIDMILLVKDYQNRQKELEEKQQEILRQQEEVASLSEEWQEREVLLEQWSRDLAELERRLRERQEQFYRRKGELERQESLSEQYRHEIQASEKEVLDLRQEEEDLEHWLVENRPREEVLAREVRSFAQTLALEEEEIKRVEQTLQEAKKALEAAREEGEKCKDLLVTHLTELSRIKNTRASLLKLKEERQRRNLRQQEEKAQILDRLAFLDAASRETLKTLEEARAALQGIQEQRSRLEQRKKERDAFRIGLEDRLRDLEGKRRQDLAQIQNLQVLMDSHQNYESGVRALLALKGEGSDPALPLFREVLVQGLETEPGCEMAVEAALGNALQGLMIHDIAWAWEGIGFLKQRREGRATFLPPVPAPERADRISARVREKGWIPLISKVKAAESFRPWVEALLGSFILVEDIRQGWEIWREEEGRVAVVTPEGDLIDVRGVLSGGSPAPVESGILFQKNMIRKLEKNLTLWQEEMEKVRAEIEVLGKEQEELEKETRALDEIRQEKEERVREAEKRLVGYQEETKPLKRRLEIIGMEEDEYRHLEEKHLEEEGRLFTQEDEINRKIDEVKREKQAQDQTIEHLAAALEEKRQDLTRAYARLSALKEKGEHIGREWNRLQEVMKEKQDRLLKLSERVRAGEELQTQLRGKAEAAARLIESLTVGVAEMESQIQKDQQEWEEKVRQKEEGERSLKETRSRLNEAEHQEIELKMELAQIRMKTDHLIEQIQGQTNLPPEEWVGHYLKGDEDLEALKEKRRELKEKLEQLGEVNLTALEEYNAFKERYDFLHAQEEDLLKSIDSLKRAIQKINATSRELFLSAFQAIQEKMNEVFPILFGGGTAKLSLTDEADPLEAGVEIMVQPPGKRVTNMSLLSGGEKALTALSLLFATYLVRPSPFCLLDEIDAFLDEANVERFKNLVRNIVRDSQIILITHNRRIMEMADTLYGVTMEQPGISKLVSVKLDQVQ